MLHARFLTTIAAVGFIAACGGGQEAKQPPDCHTLSTGCGAAPLGESDASAAGTPTSSNEEKDAGGAVTAVQPPSTAVDAGAPQDEMAKSVSVCGDEAAPVEKRLRPKIKACFFEAKAKDPSLDGHVRVTLVIDEKGKIKKIDIAQAKQLGAAATSCMIKALKESNLDAARCPGKTVGFEQAFGRAVKD